MTQLSLCLLPLLVLTLQAEDALPPCFFPESESRSFFYDVDSDVAPWTAIVESVVDPPDARLLLASVRPEHPLGVGGFEINFTERFTLVSTPHGKFALHSVLPLTLPPQVNRTKLFVTVICNDEAFPLFTIRVTSKDTGNPQFYNEPYYVDVSESISVGETVVTPIVVVDWDSENAAPELRIEDADSPFKIITELTNSSSNPVVKVGNNQTTTRQPTLVLLKLVKPIKRLPITLRLVAEDVNDRARNTATSILIRAKPKNVENLPNTQESQKLGTPPRTDEEERIQDDGSGETAPHSSTTQSSPSQGSDGKNLREQGRKNELRMVQGLKMASDNVETSTTTALESVKEHEEGTATEGDEVEKAAETEPTASGVIQPPKANNRAKLPVPSEKQSPKVISSTVQISGKEQEETVAADRDEEEKAMTEPLAAISQKTPGTTTSGSSLPIPAGKQPPKESASNSPSFEKEQEGDMAIEGDEETAIETKTGAASSTQAPRTTSQSNLPISANKQLPKVLASSARSSLPLAEETTRNTDSRMAFNAKEDESKPENNVRPNASVPSTSLSSSERRTTRIFKRIRHKIALPIARADPPRDPDATRFEECAIAVSLPENSEPGTLVTTLHVLNRKKWTMIDMVNPDGTFLIRQDTGEVFVRDNRLMDRELFSQLELVAEIHGSSHMTECARIRISVELLDENDNKPAFEKEMYTFIVSDRIPVEEAVGVVRARDIDEGLAGRVSYRIVNESVPFQIRRKGKDGEIITKEELFGPRKYRLLLEAHDNAPPFQSSRIFANIFVTASGKPTTTTTASPSTEKVTRKRINGVLSATLEPLDLNLITEPLNGRETSAEASLTRSAIASPAPVTRPHRTRKRLLRTSTVVTVTTTFATTTTIPTTTAPRPVHPTLLSHVDDEIKMKANLTVNSMTSTESSEDYSSSESEEESGYNGSFAFDEPTYYFEVFGPPREGDILGRVEARPRTQMYGLERNVSGAFKIDPDIGEISVGRTLGLFANGNHTFEVSATDGLHTAHTVVTVRLDTRRNRNEAEPRFEKSRYVFRIEENRPPSVIGVVRAYHVALSSGDISLQYEIFNDFGNPSLPFRVHGISGEVTSEAPLDHEERKSYEFKIRACLSVNPTNCGYTAVVVIVDDLNDNSPHFPESEVQISLPSDLPTGSDVITLQATDADSGPNGDVNYAINPPSEVFGIDYHTGVVQTIAPLTESLYEVEVEAFDHGDPKRTEITKLIISVHGTNPSAPVFDEKQYEVTVTSPVRAGSVVAKMNAKDPDPGLEGQITYRFDTTDSRNQAHTRKFSINEQTGVVSAIEPLTAKDGPFDLVVIAEDQSTIYKRKTTAVLHIEIVGDTSLRFLPLPSTIYISTEKAVGSVVLRASAFTASLMPVHFRILEDDAPFVMDGDLLRVASHLSPGETNLTVRAETDNAHSDHRLKVVVMYDRDKYPVFPQLTYDIDIPIDSAFPLTAHRFDAQLLNGTLMYRFFPDGTAPVGLSIHPNSGELIVDSAYANTPSNHDTQFVVVRAINLNYPEFYSDVGVAISLVSSKSLRFPQSIYRMQLTENTPIGTALYPPLEVFPKSPGVTYTINPLTPLSILSNGTLIVNSPVDLEKLPVDQSGSLHFVITATSGDARAAAKLQLKIKDVNEFAPEFENGLYEASVPEDAVPGSVITQVRASDADRTDGKHLLYRIAGGSGRELVFIQEDGTLVLGDYALDQETLKQFDVIVEAIDHSGNKDSTTVRVTIEDHNDNAPVFELDNLVWNVTEGSRNATLEIVATDRDTGKNGEIKFRLIGGNQELFLIENKSPHSAILKLNGPLDHETQTTYELTIEARDGGNPPKSSTAVVRVNVINRNDSPPVFKKINYEQEVPSNLPVGHPILTLSVNDADRDRVTFSVLGDKSCSSLSVDPYGVVSFSKPASSRSVGEVTCIISATDGVHTSNATLRLNISDTQQPTVKTPQKNHPPRFTSEIYTVTITPEKEGQVLKKVRATDSDGDAVSYSIEPPEFRNLFNVDAQGQITARVPTDELKQAMYSFLIVAEDDGNPVMTSFTNIRVKVPENENHVVTANSLEGSATVFTDTPITPSSSGRSKPAVSQTKSPTSVHGSRTTMSWVNIRPSVSTTSSPIETTEAAISFKRRKYTYAIRTDSPVGTYLGQVEVNNKADVGLVFENTRQFEFDKDGWIRSVGVFSSPERIQDNILAIKEDEVVATVPFVVHILTPEMLGHSTSPKPSTTERTTMATETSVETSESEIDVPDLTSTIRSVSLITSRATEPSTAEDFTSFFPSPIPVGESQVSSTEESATFSSSQLTDTSEESHSSSSEPIFVQTKFPPLQITEVTTVKVQRSTLEAEATTVAGMFAFTKPMYFAFVPEGQYTNGIRLSVKPEPLSVNRDTEVRYEIDDDTHNIPFFITTDGQLVVFDVDRERKSSYMFGVKATSPEFGEVKTTINVTILDTNDNYPIFGESPSAIGIYKDIAVGTPLFHFNAQDKDADNYGAITYGLEEPESPFEINADDGTLSIAHALDSTPEYSLTVFARDNGRPSLKSTQRVTINVFDPSVETPQFRKEQPESVVFFGTPPDSEVATVLAGPTINTKPDQERILYNLENDYGGLFAVEDGGRVILTRRPTADEVDRYVQLNITAENSQGKDWTTLNVFLEGNNSTTTSPQKPIDKSKCYFPTKVYTAEIMENLSGRRKLTKVTSNCETEGRPYSYSFVHPTQQFELNPKTGEVFVILPLDREERTYNFLYIDVSSEDESTPRRVVRENPIIKNARASLNYSQTLVVVRVLDENDNAPAFLHGADDDDSLVAVVDWQARLFSPVIRLEAKDADEHAQLSYSLSGTNSDYFAVNATSGLVVLAKSIAEYTGDSFKLTATVTDGIHIVPTPLRIYVISPSSSLVQLTSEVPHSMIDQRNVERMLNELNGLDNRLLIKQPFVDQQGHADPKRSHLFVYALDKRTRIPYLKEDLAKVLEHHAASLLSSPSKISEVSLLSPPATLSAFDLTLAILCILLLLLLLAACCILTSYCKKRRAIATSDREYMVSTLGGPRPYDVEEVTRTTAQRVLSARPLPEPMTNQIEVAVSPIFVGEMTNKSDTTQAFSNSIRERPSLLQSALARQKVHAADVKPMNSQQN